MDSRPGGFALKTQLLANSIENQLNGTENSGQFGSVIEKSKTEPSFSFPYSPSKDCSRAGTIHHQHHQRFTAFT